MATASFTPYTYFQCPCSDNSSTATRESDSRPTSSHRADGADGGEADKDDHTFDPRSPRANYSLYPLEHILYCEDCHQIRCPRCVAEEILTYYCPSCLFEVPLSNIKSEGNRCARSCFQCPVCVAPLTVTNTTDPSQASPAPGPDAPSAAGSGFMLWCSFCQWSSTEVGLQFDKANALYGQLAKMRNGGRPRFASREQKMKRRELGAAIPSSLSAAMTADEPAVASSATQSGAGEEGLDLETQFSNLRHFYQKQMAETSGSGVSALSSFGDLNFASPASLSRIMSMYTAGGGASRLDKKQQQRIRSMREARDESEGFMPAQLDESEAIARLHKGVAAGHNHTHGLNGWDSTTSAEQRAWQVEYVGEERLYGRQRFLEELRPVPCLLRTKRSKRCPVCRHIISKPEAKSTNSRYRLRLVASLYIPGISIRPLVAPAAPPPVPKTSSRSAPVVPPPPVNILEPLKPVQYILTFTNPIFETVKVTLATPSTTPGRFASKVTVLCPQFEVDPNTDVWDDALRDSSRAGVAGSGDDGSGQQQATAGKIWKRGRNWVSIVVEIVPPSLNLDLLATMNKPIGNQPEGQTNKIDLSPLREDEDIVEIPMFVRLEWEAEAGQDGVGATSSKDKDAKEKRELAYWCVLGIGRVRQ